ncbi:uncharacterized protein BDV14DRAFT_190590 [Aspergillus stella-maris]|uniref:uncharacterized protein n=1 Tax=Aspergillus stella-maris TaxID=1810926 RepID=UPI003CCE3308
MPGAYVDHVESASLPFNPEPEIMQDMPMFSMNFVPRYLYRLVAPQSAGTTTAATIVPPLIEGRSEDIFHYEPRKAASQLLNHLLWQRGHASLCNLMSWTSSLLFALQYALYRHRRDGDDLRHIQLIVLDTTLFPAGTFIQDMEIMRAFQASDYHLQKFVEFRESEYYFGEYLTQGRLAIQDRCVCTSVQNMINLGLFDLQPALGDEHQWQWWPKRVLDFRKQFVASERAATKPEHVEKAVSIARQCFGGQWTVPVTIMLLALQPRKKNDAVIAQGLKASFTAADIKSAGLSRMKIDSRRLPEVAQFKELVQFTQRTFTPSEYESLADSLQGLNVG